MIDLDIKEHQFANKEIINNGGIPTSSMASEIFESAKRSNNDDLSERYMLYLEAAKALRVTITGDFDEAWNIFRNVDSHTDEFSAIVEYWKEALSN